MLNIKSNIGLFEWKKNLSLMLIVPTLIEIFVTVLFHFKQNFIFFINIFFI